MNSKKIISAIMAGVCALSMTSIAAFAADETQKVTAAGEKDLSVEAGYTAPVIDVTLPTSLKAVINPYKIEIEIASGVSTGTDGITSPEYDIVNNSDTFGIKVGAKLSAKGTGIAVVSDKTKIPTKLDSEKTAYAELKTTVGTEEKVLAFTEDKPDRATNVMTLGKKGNNDTGKFQIQGAVTDPEIVEKPYAVTDKLALTIIFELNPFNPGGAGGAGGGGGFTAVVAADDISVGSSGIVLGALKANDTYTATVDGTSAALSEKLTFTGYSNYTVTSSDTTVLAIGVAANAGKVNYPATPKNGTTTLTYTLTPDAGGSNVTLMIEVEVTGIT